MSQGYDSSYHWDFDEIPIVNDLLSGREDGEHLLDDDIDLGCVTRGPRCRASPLRSCAADASSVEVRVALPACDYDCH